jgi:hypothetical protein
MHARMRTRDEAKQKKEKEKGQRCEEGHFINKRENYVYRVGRVGEVWPL